MKEFPIPVTVEAGSQPPEEDGVELDYMQLPTETWTYEVPVVPEPDEIQGLEPGIEFLGTLATTLANQTPDAPAVVLPLTGLDDANLHLIDQVLGNGEVSIIYEGPVKARVQESVLAGVWRVQYLSDDESVERDVVEVGAIPTLISDGVFTHAAAELVVDAEKLPEGLANAPSLLVEISDKLRLSEDHTEPYVVNLSLLPNTDEDLQYLIERLGSGPAVILSRGYGNCRITSTGTRNVWWVQYFNSQDALILNTVEISRVPAVACAAREDLEDSAERLREILEVYR